MEVLALNSTEYSFYVEIKPHLLYGMAIISFQDWLK